METENKMEFDKKVSILESPEVTGMINYDSTKDLEKHASIKTEKTVQNAMVLGALQKENKNESPKLEGEFKDKNYSERESMRLVKRGQVNEKFNYKGMNEDIIIDVKDRQKIKKGIKSKRPQQKILGPYLTNAHSQKLESETPKKKFEALKSRYAELNEHLKQSEIKESLHKRASQSP